MMSEEREKKLARLVLEIEACEAERKAQSKEYADRIKELEEQRDKLAREIRDGQQSIFTLTPEEQAIVDQATAEAEVTPAAPVPAILTGAGIETALSNMNAALSLVEAANAALITDVTIQPEEQAPLAAAPLAAGDDEEAEILDQKAFNEGADARENGLDQKANPHRIGSIQWSSWEMGWGEADDSIHETKILRRGGA